MNRNESSAALKSLTLESVKSQFSEWRATHGKGNRIPISLWNAVRELTKSYSYHQIASELKISPSLLHKKIGPSRQDPPLLPDSHFIKVKVPLSPVSSATEPPQLEQKIFFPSPHTGSIELTRVDGTILKASGLDNKALLSFVQSFLSG